MGNYLVTGAAGFIGAAVAAALVRQGHDVWTIDNLSTGYRDAIPPGVTFIEGDCADAAVIARLPKTRWDAIYHIAGQSSGEVSYDDPVYDLHSNAQSTLQLLRHALEVGCQRLIYAGTMSVYGAQPDAPVSEAAATKPTSFYGVGKLASEHYLRLYESHGIRSTVLRLFNVYGPGQNMKNLRQGMVSIYLAQAIESRRIVVKGDPSRYRDHVYIDDVVDAFLSCERRPEAFGCVFNVCSGRRTTVQSLLDAIASALGGGIEVELKPGTPGDVFGIFGDPGAIERALGWRAKVTLEDGLERFVAWATAASSKKA